MSGHDDEERLYLWVRVFGAITLLVTMSLIALAVAVVPIFNPDYHPDTSAIVFIIGTLGTASLALVGVELRLRRNGNGKGG